MRSGQNVTTSHINVHQATISQKIEFSCSDKYFRGNMTQIIS